MVLLHTRQPPEMAEWQAYLLELGKVLREERLQVHIFVATDGGGPNARQRKDLAQILVPANGLTHVFTADAMVRGIVTAFRWISRAGAVAHAPEEFRTAVWDCGLVPEDVLHTMVAESHSLPPIHVLSDIRATVEPNAQTG